MLVFVIIMAFTGCAAQEAASPAPASPTSPSPATPASVEPSSDPTTTATCETVLTPAAMADIDAAGYLPIAAVPAGPDSIMASMIDQGGFSCYWASAGGDVVAWLGQVGMDSAAWSAQQSELLAAGFTESDDPFPGTLQGARSGDDYPTLVNDGGVTYYVSTPSFLSSVAALQNGI